MQPGHSKAPAGAQASATAATFLPKKTIMSRTSHQKITPKKLLVFTSPPSEASTKHTKHGLHNYRHLRDKLARQRQLSTLALSAATAAMGTANAADVATARLWQTFARALKSWTQLARNKNDKWVMRSWQKLRLAPDRNGEFEISIRPSVSAEDTSDRRTNHPESLDPQLAPEASSICTAHAWCRWRCYHSTLKAWKRIHVRQARRWVFHCAWRRWRYYHVLLFPHAVQLQTLAELINFNKQRRQIYKSFLRWFEFCSFAPVKSLYHYFVGEEHC